MQLAIIHLSIIFALYIISAFSTTDILRLLSGSETPVLAASCFCPACRKPIPLRCQIPIISYLKHKGACYSCGSQIPKTELFLESFLFCSMTLAAVISGFSWPGFVSAAVLFETTKLCFFCRFGIRKSHFLREFLISLLLNLIIFALLGFLFFLSVLFKS